MKWIVACLLAAVATQLPASAQAQSGAAAVQTSGTVVIVSAVGEVKQANDEAIATLTVEEQDKDRALAASRVNQKMKQGMETIRKEDPTAVLQTRGYFTYPVYGDEGQPRPQSNRNRQIVGWRVGQSLEVKTSNLDNLPRTVAAAQRILALSGLHFGLAEKTAKALEEQRIAAAYRNLMERIGAVARAMGRNPADAMLDTVDFEASGNYAPMEATMPKAMRAAAAPANVEEPSFEPGETTLVSRVVGKVRFR
ncbi:SIMPL domain-containing protein [Noviherbaspirillum galbum]|uniref:SIMPL domain-containing protein n=1 Tax=Noviherbaspirillum galbum TaxID=2709383 RepID=A0A6B3SLY7_9BURK|nr:SIMPL domain-containing protein [Noviherbaspirillum galbum]NEX61831.1 SIMPL domain-containing protein [Noviherbaspirillum galbum]